MNKYYDLLVQLSLQQCLKDDYSDEYKVKQHNDASRRILLIKKELRNTDCSNLLYKLLRHPDNRVKINASSLCAETGLSLEQAIITLSDIITFEKDETLRFSAKMILSKIRKLLDNSFV